MTREAYTRKSEKDEKRKSYKSDTIANSEDFAKKCCKMNEKMANKAK